MREVSPRSFDCKRVCFVLSVKVGDKRHRLEFWEPGRRLFLRCDVWPPDRKICARTVYPEPYFEAGVVRRELRALACIRFQFTDRTILESEFWPYCSTSAAENDLRMFAGSAILNFGRSGWSTHDVRYHPQVRTGDSLTFVFVYGI